MFPKMLYSAILKCNLHLKERSHVKGPTKGPLDRISFLSQRGYGRSDLGEQFLKTQQNLHKVEFESVGSFLGNPILFIKSWPTGASPDSCHCDIKANMDVLLAL